MDTHLRVGATHLNLEPIHPKQAATPRHRVATPLHKEATHPRPADTHPRPADTQPKPVVTLLQRVVILKRQAATPLNPGATLPPLEDTLLQEGIPNSLLQGATPQCLQQQVEAGAQHQADSECREELHRVTQQALHRDSPCLISQQALDRCLCRDMEAVRPTPKPLVFLKATGVRSKTFLELIH